MIVGSTRAKVAYVSMPPVESPVNRGRSSTKRKLGVVEKRKKTPAAAKKARGAAAQGVAAGDE